MVVALLAQQQKSLMKLPGHSPFRFVRNGDSTRSIIRQTVLLT